MTQIATIDLTTGVNRDFLEPWYFYQSDCSVCMSHPEMYWASIENTSTII